jgi:hypothetical protein
MIQFKQTNFYVEYDEDYNKVVNPATGKIVLKGNPAQIASQWQKDVLSVLEDLYLHSRLSRQMFDALNLAGADPLYGGGYRILVIKPYTPTDEKPTAFGVCNAFAAPKSASAQSQETFDGTRKGNGAGPGSSCEIHYDKARWCVGSRCGPTPASAGDYPAETLLHEMLHGLRQLAGQQDMSAIGLDYDTMEEFYAILLTNVYMSERGRKRLRKNHHGNSPLDKDAATSEGFLMFGDHVRWLTWLVNRGAVMVRRVAEINAPFNPIRAYLADPKKYIAIMKAQGS